MSWLGKTPKEYGSWLIPLRQAKQIKCPMKYHPLNGSSL